MFSNFWFHHIISLFPNYPLFCSQCGNMAREGLRTLVVAKKSLSEEQYTDFEVQNIMSLLNVLLN